MKKPRLALHDLHQRHPGLTPALAASYREAACVCFDRHHRSPILLRLETEDEWDLASEVLVRWPRSDERTLAAWANEIDTTEAAAYAVILAAVELISGLVAIGRAETLTGADYYLAPAGTALEDFENCYRLEISGLDRAPDSAVRRRLEQKLAQAARGQSQLPALAGVVGFDAKLILISRLD
ncbi:MAG: hypothetical protein AAGD01_03945 [Acidobacteriota bacterium]